MHFKLFVGGGKFLRIAPKSAKIAPKSAKIAPKFAKIAKFNSLEVIYYDMDDI